MSFRRGRVRRPDDWPSSHVRARADLSDRLDFALEPDEAVWLASHLEACPDCRVVADAYAAQALELRSLRDRMPMPPRDLWARTAAAIESESRFRDGRARSAGWRDRRVVAPSALIAAALVVAVASGLLTSSQQLGSGGDGGSPGLVAKASPPVTTAAGSVHPGATPILVPARIEYLSKSPTGKYSINTKNVDQVCPDTSPQPCDANAPTVEHPVNLNQDASTVYGSPHDERLIVVNDPTSPNSGTISVVPIGSEAPATTPSPTPTLTVASGTPASVPPSTGPTPAPHRTPSLPPVSPPPTATPTPSATPTSSAGGSPSPSVEVTPPTNGGAIEIAHDVVLVGQSAAYSADGRWFAFTAHPADSSIGPDIYVWKVGDLLANPVTTDHRSVFGSWAGGVMVGSTVVATTTGNGASARTDVEPASFLLDPTTRAVTPLPQTGHAWRPAVDPTGRFAVYWAGTLRATTATDYAPDAGRLVLGDWAAAAAASDAPAPTTLKGDQGTARHETTISSGRLEDWDARWDSTGTHLAIWIADPQNPAVGNLSLYAVDSFDGKIDLKSPLLNQKRAIAGYSIADGQLVWAEPAADGSTSGGRIQLLAWTAEGSGTVGTVTGPVIVIR